MAGSAHRWIVGTFVLLAALAALPLRAQEAAYRCGPHTYSQVACTGGRVVGATPHRSAEKYKTPPQDRAIAMRRAALSPEERRACHALDVQLREQQRVLRARGKAATPEDEAPLLRTKNEARDRKC